MTRTIFGLSAAFYVCKFIFVNTLLSVSTPLKGCATCKSFEDF